MFPIKQFNKYGKADELVHRPYVPIFPPGRFRPLALAIWRVLLASMLVIMTASCGSLGKRKTPPPAPPASCGERIPAISPPDPPNNRDYRDWAAVYIQSVYAWMDAIVKRKATADCIDEHRRIKP